MSDNQAKEKNMSRRDFLATAAVLTAGTTIAGSALAQQAVKQTVSTSKVTGKKKGTFTTKVDTSVKLTSPFTNKAITLKDMLTNQNWVEEDLVTMVEFIVDDIRAEAYSMDAVATGMDYLNFDSFAAMTDVGGGSNFGEPETGGTGTSCKSDGQNCGLGCEGSPRSGSQCGSNCESSGNICGSNCGNSCGNSCTPLTDNLAENAFLVNFNENMRGTNNYVVELVNHYKANIIQRVATQIMR